MIALIWGASFLFIKVAVQDMGPMVLVLIGRDPASWPSRRSWW
jgi:hypothetical protein